MNIKASGGHRICEICGIRERHIHEALLFAQFPLNVDRCREWVKAVGKEDLVYVPLEKLHDLRHICQNHFKKKDINRKGNRLKRRAIPTINLNATPLTDEQLIDFPQRLWKDQDEEVCDSRHSISLQDNIIVQEFSNAQDEAACESSQLISSQENIIIQTIPNAAAAITDEQPSNICLTKPSTTPEVHSRSLTPQITEIGINDNNVLQIISIENDDTDLRLYKCPYNVKAMAFRHLINKVPQQKLENFWKDILEIFNKHSYI